MKEFETATFHKGLLHPRYWLVWFGFGLLALIVTIFPYPVLKKLGRGLGKLVAPLIKKRAKIIRKNLELCFPDMEEAEKQRITDEVYKNSGLALIETGIAWFWPTWRFKRIINFKNHQHVLDLEAQGKGVLVVCTHMLNLEITARAFSLFAPGYGVYRPHENPAVDFIQNWGRTRFGHQMVDREDVRGMVRVLKSGGRLWYLPDQDYGSQNSVYVPFFAYDKACTPSGTGFLVDMGKCAVITASSLRDGNQYCLEIDSDISANFPRRDPEGAAVVMNHAIEKVITRGMDQYMWMHRRFKTMHDGSERGHLYND
ncbi:Lipid A biosynthesis lauroyl acyltransferase [Vibrio nigripulchritudo SO65]|uniref:LpxL/LpxP family Kdo(2)-lipid IV(A) lauroyl/palmitoleoyl acyltransferase n=1 Tax=Vibrio nigripulchritudo TaxID=28173 RepID=UPI0003B2393C|nr:LpxL/LpxP family Kdo(2)-lipid IV(A) lauroyl/palmitoleoyl acyltransferase [Vibrio nigripulchritudo]CCN37764.1 Lipid A biosynthesis lauroyl acyltransferase [Vibrio nigripulchritudo AM115]CCN39970.1 Lipid A biosynthesis lauroyl acyltransferase [Vibrio nigripulchritudo FTn2]CCN64781.1 Lipid A biosynthesis lauroyl acyltransferase [Vibrio nigripulchritudo POn4]CCN78234.1 Lipid A biosynthesis lauroyl acyltransferase [Vibrio nigripulchritudo SO65]